MRNCRQGGVWYTFGRDEIGWTLTIQVELLGEDGIMLHWRCCKDLVWCCVVVELGTKVEGQAEAKDAVSGSIGGRLPITPTIEESCIGKAPFRKRCRFGVPSWCNDRLKKVSSLMITARNLSPQSMQREPNAIWMSMPGSLPLIICNQRLKVGNDSFPTYMIKASCELKSATARM